MEEQSNREVDARLEAAAERFEERMRKVTEALDERLGQLDPPAPDEPRAPGGDDEIVELLEANEALEGRLSELKVRCEHLEAALGKADSELSRRKPSEALETQLEELSARCRELEASKAAVEAAVGRNSDTLRAVAREMRLPLRGMLGLLEPLHACRKLDDRQRLGVSASESSVRILLSLLDGFEDLAAIEDDAFEPGCAIFDLHAMTRDTINLVAPVASSLGLEVALSVDPTVPPRVCGDAQRLQRLILHLTSQALGFALQGAVTVCVALESVSESGPVVRFSVHSDGAGVPVERLRELLDPITAAGTAEDQEGVDMRLGMMLYRQLTETMGGRIGVEAVSGGGFAIWFSIDLDHPGTIASERNADRTLQEMLVCNLGPVIDLSVSGIRVLCRKVPRQKADVTISEGGRKLKLKATLVWVRRLDNSYVEAGLHFLGLSNEQVALLHDIATQHTLRQQHSPAVTPMREGRPNGSADGPFEEA